MKGIRRETVAALWNHYKYVVLVILAGVVLLAWPTGGGEKKEPAQTEEIGMTLEETEEKMQEILSQISGVGRLSLMLTLDATGEQALAQDSELSFSGSEETPEEYQRRSETVVLSKSGGEDSAVVTGSTYPVYRGALVVCEGGENAEVKLAVTQAVAALTGLSTDRITVVKCQ